MCFKTRIKTEKGNIYKMIHVYKKWYIDADKLCYCLFKRTKAIDNKTGEEKYNMSNKTYHATVSQCLQQFIRVQHRKLTHSKQMELKEAIKQFQKIESFVKKTVSGIEI